VQRPLVLHMFSAVVCVQNSMRRSLVRAPASCTGLGCRAEGSGWTSHPSPAPIIPMTPARRQRREHERERRVLNVTEGC
jgi:hypothetical protein